MDAINKKVGIIICSRSASNRIKEKPFQLINGQPLIRHLVSRLEKTCLPIVLAIPKMEESKYIKALGSSKTDFYLDYENYDNPLKRMYCAALYFGLEVVVRITHDKMFIEPRILIEAVDRFLKTGVDYLSCKNMVQGSTFEIISFSSLAKAAKQFDKVEHITYAIRAITQSCYSYEPENLFNKPYRFLIDYPEDLTLMELLCQRMGNHCTLTDALGFMHDNEWAIELNRMPEISIYTCAYNAEKYINEAMNSVIKQSCFKKSEYIVIDDFSSDSTYMMALRASHDLHNMRVARMPHNLGLSTCSNVALQHAKGKYIIRLDADDFFPQDYAIQKIHKYITNSLFDVVYPNNFLGDFGKIQKGYERHHVGGAMFKKSAVDHIRFTDGLRHYEGLDLFERARKYLKIGYMDEPIFYYRQHDESMSSNNFEEREKIKEIILSKGHGQ